jgi:glycosyltransferase involved in cell wall biosynthesis
MDQERYAPVTVVIPCFNCETTIHRAVASVAAQTLRPAEVWLVDDASSDAAAAVFATVEQTYPGWVRLITLATNQGAGGARNAGWEAATQEFVAFLDADDTWHPEKIAVQCRYMQSQTEVVLSGHAHRVITDPLATADWPLNAEQGCEASPVSKRQMLFSNQFITPSVMLRRSIPVRFAHGRRHMEDHLLWLEVIINGGQVVRLSANLAVIYKHSFGVSGLSAQMWKMECADLTNYRILYRCGHLSACLWLVLSGLSILKYGRRLLARYGRRLLERDSGNQA